MGEIKLQWTNLIGILKDYFNKNKSLIYIITPFLNEQLLKKLIVKQQQVIIISSWRKDHLLSGLSSLETYRLCKENNWKLFINSRVHLKFYSNQLDSAWIGSANLTYKALNDRTSDNHEVLTFIDNLSSKEKIFIQKIQAESLYVNDEVYSKYKAWLDSQKPLPKLGDPEDLDLGIIREEFLTSQLPHSDNPKRLWEVANTGLSNNWWDLPSMEHDLGTFPVPHDCSFDEYCDMLSINFFSQKFIKKFCDSISKEGMRFGQIKQWIKNNCTDIPVPHARDLTFPVQALIHWIEFLAPDKYEIVIPGARSEVIRLRK